MKRKIILKIYLFVSLAGFIIPVHSQTQSEKVKVSGEHFVKQDNKVAIKLLPFPDPKNISTLLIDGSQHLTSHIYVYGH